MKRTLLFIGCILASTALFAQDVYHTFLEEGKVWTYFYYNMVGKTYNVTRVVDGDTIIGGLAYKKICDKIGGNYQYALREEGKQVYIVHDHYETPQLLYDFSKDKGDIITKEIDEKCGLVSEMRVIGVDTIDIDGLKIRRLQIWKEVYNIENPIDWEKVEVPWQGAFYWIEGVGSECLLETSFREEGNYYNLKSCQINGRTYSQQELLQEPSKPQNDYIPFVKDGKQWHVVRTAKGESSHFEQYMMNEEVVLNGKTYMKMSRTEDDKAVIYDEGLLREENRKVYFYDTDMQKEFLLFDYSLKEGDKYETYSYEDQKMVTYEVLQVSDYTIGPKVISYEYDVAGDSTVIQYRPLRHWLVKRADSQGWCLFGNILEWLEGVGSLQGPLANRYLSLPAFTSSYLACAFSDDNYFPFSFYDGWNRGIYGCDLTAYAINEPKEWNPHLTYERDSRRLHVYGELVLNCAGHNYAYFIDEPTDDPLVHKLHFEKQEVGLLATCVSLHRVDFYVSELDPKINYIVVDDTGEHPVINKAPQDEYRPFVEEGKVWKVGAINSGNPVQWVEYYYFDGDTIIDGKTCKQMMHQRYVNPDFAESYYISQDNSINYVGTWYEENQKVYEYDSISNQFNLMYDFSANAYDTLQINNERYIIGARQTGGLKGFKGVYRDVANHMAWKTTWLEGVGGLYGPTINIYPGKLDPAWFLMSCTIGDEVIYLNDEYEDGATPEVLNAPKSRFDFTHIIKTRPKAPKRRGADQSIYGEYNEHQLGINLDPLDEAYLVRITDDKSGKVVYEKAINAGNIVALNIDISANPKGHYTITVENSLESFTGEFDTIVTGIVEVRNKKIEVRDVIYNLQGQRISYLQKGLNIVNGRKVMVK